MGSPPASCRTGVGVALLLAAVVAFGRYAGQRVQAELQSRAALGRQSPLHGGHAVRELKEPQLALLPLDQGQLPKSVGILAMPYLLGRLAQLPGVLLGGDLQKLALGPSPHVVGGPGDLE